MSTLKEINSLEYWEEQKLLASKDAIRARDPASRAAAIEHVADAEREIRRIKRAKAGHH
jgi:hypothetical protein